jgi:uncharacterized lipoprotein YehR (DUF1307 family)
MQRILVLVLFLFTLMSCGHRRDAKTFEKALEAATGQGYQIAKLWSENGKYVVYKNESTGEYVAYNMDKWDRKTMTSFDQFTAGAVEGVDVVRNLARNKEWVESGYWKDDYDTVTEYYEYYDEDCECWEWESYTYTVYVGTYWVDTSHWYTFYTGGGFRFNSTSSQSKDLETMAALEEEVAEKFLAHKLSSEFSLSATRADELAKLATRYQKLENARELTDQEKDTFAMEALGVSMNQIESAIKKKTGGESDAYEQLLKQASVVNKTTPEQIGKIFDEIILELE